MLAHAGEVYGFITLSGLYLYTVMSCGLRNDPVTFQLLMNRGIAPLEGCVVYSDTWLVHLSCIYKLFKHLAWAGVTINLAKCDFTRVTLSYLGRVLGEGCVQGQSSGYRCHEKRAYAFFRPCRLLQEFL